MSEHKVVSAFLWKWLIWGGKKHPISEPFIQLEADQEQLVSEFCLLDYPILLFNFYLLLWIIEYIDEISKKVSTTVLR